jgi:hypothetical protein
MPGNSQEREGLMPAPKGNRNASPKVSYAVIAAYAGLIAFGEITRAQAKAELGIADGRVRRWFRPGPVQFGPPKRMDVIVRQRYMRRQKRKERHDRLCAILRAEIARLYQSKLIT